MTKIDQVLVGQLQPIGPRDTPSGIRKAPVMGRVFLGWEGLHGDAQGDRKHHGGVEKALHHYARDHYAYWTETIGPHAVLGQPGAFGENLTSYGLTETEVAVGDVFRLGEAVIEVSQGRQPCWKLNTRFDVPDMALQVQRSGRTGWYYRVIEPGHIQGGETLDCVDRKTPAWTLDRLWRALYVNTLDLDELAAMAEVATLADNWRAYARKRLQTRSVEDWSRRLNE